MLTWRGEQETISANITLLDDGVAFRAAMRPTTQACAVAALEYPILGGLTDQGDRTYLAHGWTTGVLVQNPASVLPETGALRFTPYPESFSGASLQLMSLYHQGQAGLYLAAHDGAGHQKWLNAYTHQGTLILSHMAGMEDLRPGAPVEMTWDFVVRFTPGTGWEDAAEMYRDFALSQPWCRRGPLYQRTDRARHQRRSRSFPLAEALPGRHRAERFPRAGARLDQPATNLWLGRAGRHGGLASIPF